MVLSRPVFVSAAAIALLSGCALLSDFVAAPDLQPDFQRNETTPVDVIGVSKGRMFETTQDWSDDTRDRFWHVPQGSLAAPFDLAMAVEQADAEALFMDPANIARYRYVPQSARPAKAGRPESGNPDGLPLGFTRSNTKFDGTAYLGMTCSACHSTLVTYKGNGLLIDGAPTMGDFQTFWGDFTKAFRANLEPTKFDRLAARLGATGAAKTALRARLEDAAKVMETRERLNATTTQYGYGRVDAIGQIYNSVSVQNTGIDNNRGDPNAPVSYPFLWGTHQSNLVQWNGFAPNAPRDADLRIAGPLIRNFGEVLGVFGRIEVNPTERDPATTYRNSVRIENLLAIEEWLERLGPPSWPEDLLGDIDIDKAARGKVVYADKTLGNCQGCHAVPDDVFACYDAVMVPLKGVGTDPAQATNSLRLGKTGPLDGRYALFGPPLAAKTLGPEAPILDMVKHQIGRSLAHDMNRRKLRSLRVLISTVRQERSETTCSLAPFAPEKPEDLLRYKARPLNGIWATAPFLHNGSVPTLRALLDAPADRPQTFTLGGWEFDPVGVGYAPYTGPNAFTFDTTLPGNSNAGHIWGANLSDEDKAALVEYMKTL